MKKYLSVIFAIVTIFLLTVAFDLEDAGGTRLRWGTATMNDTTSTFVSLNKGLIANGDVTLTNNLNLNGASKVSWQSSTYGDAFNISGNGGELDYSATSHRFFGMNGAGLMFDVDSATATNTNTNFTKLGASAPAIKQLHLTGVVPAVSGTLTITHGLSNVSKVINYDFVIRDDSLNRILPRGYSLTAGLSTGFNFYMTPTQIVYITPAAGVNLPGDTIRVLITYTQ